MISTFIYYPKIIEKNILKFCKKNLRKFYICSIMFLCFYDLRRFELNITPIQNFSMKNTSAYTRFQQRNTSNTALEKTEYKTLSLLDTNYNSLLIKSSPITFRQKSQGSIKDMPLDEKLSTASSILAPNEIVLAGKSLDEAKSNLLDSLSTFPELISKIYFVEDDNLSGSFAIGLQNGDIPYIRNLSKEPIFGEVDDKNFFINKGETRFIYENSSFKSGASGEPFSINYGLDVNKNNIDETGVRVFDFSDMDNETVMGLNKKHIESIATGTEEEKKEVKKITFADVGGQDKAIDEIKKSVIYPLKYPKAFKVMNHGVMLVGGPGTGKSLLAEAVANESGASFIKLNGLEMESKWVGESEENWRVLFASAKENQPSIIFIDEIDAVAKQREGSTTSRHDDKVVNQLLTLMSDLEKNGDNIFVIGATNKDDLLDEALVRSGRFGKMISVPNPDLEGCRMIFDIHSKDKKLSDDFDRDLFSKKLYDAGVNGADIAAVVEDAQTNAYLRNGIFDKMENGTFDYSDIEELTIEPEDFEFALEALKQQKKSSNKNPIGFIAPSKVN